MLDIKFIRENADLVKSNSKNRLATVDIDELLKLDEQRRALIADIEALRKERNETSKSKPSDEQIAAMKSLGEKLAGLEKEEGELAGRLHELLLKVPNLSHPDVKVTTDEDDNPVIETVGEIPKFDFAPKDHVELGETLNIIDLERGAKVAGAKFFFLKKELARLNMALVNYCIDVVTRHGFQLMTTPDIAKTDIIENLGFNPRGESSQVYELAGTDLSLIGTAEITLGGYHADEVLEASALPLRYAAYTHCFRTEAGAYSKFSKGIFRVHQFDKLEMFVYCTPEQAEKLHQELLEIEKEIFSGLEIPFRVVDHCSADLGNPSYRTFDLEAWMPGKPNQDGGMGDWAEVTSTSNCTDYQARGLNIKYKDVDGKHFVYTLNGTGIAIPRALIAIMENCQQADGSIKIPKVLHSYLPFTEIKQ